ncbi:MAG: hypothetical protein Q8O20_03320 [Sulfuricurvum sp.]|uniref:hypothetical protein n=1 Tax=Sulfuricurvum sp. TaxID=2025608 RepID=UPI002732A0F3|nr:hypothetical protein [Sulfuricurvum sp.]MDP2850080.1 hypothetical protein [Sulfuricurvum sp.]
MNTIKTLSIFIVSYLFVIYINEFKIEDFPTFVVSLIALVISLIALIYTIETYMLKSGIYLRGMYGITFFNSDSHQAFINQITLENIKDKAIIIFNISMKIGDNYILLLEDFKDEPLIIKPFEIYQKKYETVYCYISNMIKLDIQELLIDQDVKKIFILSTNHGRYEVKETVNFHHPLQELSLNSCTTLVHPCRSVYKSKVIGEDVSYIIDMDDEVIFLHKGDEQLQIFNNFDLTSHSLTSRDNLEIFFEQQKQLGNIKYNFLQVIDADIVHSDIKKKYFAENKAKDNISLRKRIHCKYLTLLNLFRSQIDYMLYKMKKILHI